MKSPSRIFPPSQYEYRAYTKKEFIYKYKESLRGDDDDEVYEEENEDKTFSKKEPPFKPTTLFFTGLVKLKWLGRGDGRDWHWQLWHGFRIYDPAGYAIAGIPTHYISIKWNKKQQKKLWELYKQNKL